MSLNNICAVTIMAAMTLLLARWNFGVWFQPDKAAEGMQADPSQGVPLAEDDDDEAVATTTRRILKGVIVLLDVIVIAAWVVIWRMIAAGG